MNFKAKPLIFLGLLMLAVFAFSTSSKSCSDPLFSIGATSESLPESPESSLEEEFEDSIFVVGAEIGALHFKQSFLSEGSLNIESWFLSSGFIRPPVKPPRC
jgi:hypothetical protein